MHMPAGASYKFGDCTLTTVVTAPPYYENCYIVRHAPSGTQVIVDPGSDADKIIGHAQAGGGTVAAILLTHAHPDHMGAARPVQQAFTAPVKAHRDERPILEGLGEWSMALLGRSLQGPDDVELFPGEPTLEFAPGFSCKSIFCPGHTPGGVTFLFDGFALTGDTLFVQSVGRTDFPGGDHAQLSASITRLLEQTPDDTQLFSGHGPHWTAADAKQWWKHSPWR